MVERDLAKVDVAGSTPVSRSNFIGRGTQVVRERSAKPLRVSSILTRASKSSASRNPHKHWISVRVAKDNFQTVLILCYRLFGRTHGSSHHNLRPTRRRL